MKRQIIFLFLLITLLSCEDEYKKSIKLSHHFEENETHFFEVTKMNYLDSSLKYLHPETLTILKINEKKESKDSKNYTFLYGKTYIKSMGKDVEYEDHNKWLKTSYDKQEVVISYDLNNQHYELQNYLECQDFVKELYYKAITAEIDSAEMKNVSKIDNFISSLINSKEKVLGIYFPEVALFFKYLDKTYEIDTTYSINGFTETPFGKEKIFGDAELVLKKDKKLISISEKSKPNEEFLASIFENEVDSMSKHFDIKEYDSSIGNAIYYDDFQYKYDFDNKKFRQIYHLRSIFIGNEQKFKQIKMELVN